MPAVLATRDATERAPLKMVPRMSAMQLQEFARMLEDDPVRRDRWLGLLEELRIEEQMVSPTCGCPVVLMEKAAKQVLFSNMPD